MVQRVLHGWLLRRQKWRRVARETGATARVRGNLQPALYSLNRKVRRRGVLQDVMRVTRVTLVNRIVMKFLRSS